MLADAQLKCVYQIKMFAGMNNFTDAVVVDIGGNHLIQITND